MKHTVIFRDEDGYQVVVGFGEAVIDPHQTGQAIAAKLKDSDEFKALGAVKSRLAELSTQKIEGRKALGVLGRQGQEATKAGNSKEIVRVNAAVEKVKADLEEIHATVPGVIEQGKAAHGELMGRRLALMEENAVYFTPRAGEEIISDADYQKYGEVYAARKAENEIVCRDFSTVIDRRGENWARKGAVWTVGQIEKLGEDLPKGAIWVDDLSDDQLAVLYNDLEAARVAELTPEQKESEKAAAIARASGQAIQFRSERELETGGSAIVEAQRYYADLVAQIEAKYK